MIKTPITIPILGLKLRTTKAVVAFTLCVTVLIFMGYLVVA